MSGRGSSPRIGIVCTIALVQIQVCVHDHSTESPRSRYAPLCGLDACIHTLLSVGGSACTKAPENPRCGMIRVHQEVTLLGLEARGRSQFEQPN